MAEACGYRCWYCGGTVSLAPRAAHTASAATIDHQHPRDLGGDDSDENLVIACFACNSRKGTLTVEAYRSYLVSRDPHSRLVRSIDDAIASGVAASEELVAARGWAAGKVLPVIFHGERP